MAQSKLWHREFTRDERDDLDRLADTDFLRVNFTDFFGKWLQEGQNSNVLSFDALLMELWDGSRARPQKNTLSIFSAADGGDFATENTPWVDQALRFVAFAASGTEEPFDDATPDSWTLCVVGSSALDSGRAFLQVASWDTKMFRFYQRSSILEDPSSISGMRTGWVYHGASVDAFTDKLSYIGPFNGHINGAVVMKELHKPWLHWHTDNHSLVANIPERVKNRFKSAPYLTDQETSLVFSGVKSAESMEPIIEKGVSKWFNNRRVFDFFDGHNNLLSQPSNIRRWMAHFLLTTTVNIAVAQTIGQKWFAPANHFYDMEMLSQYRETGLMNGITVPKFGFSKHDYKQASQTMKLALIQDVSTVPPGHQELSLPRGTLGGGKQTDMLEQTRFVQVQEGELEDVMFTILQPSFEDAQGVLMIQNIKRSPQQVPVSLLSARTFNALMMLDFWNPVYSWRRAVLMQYVPKMTVYDEATHRYDLEDAFIANVKESKFYVESDPEIRRTSPEYQFISLLDIELEDYQARIQNYMNSVQARLQTIDGLVDYITLAESRRRIYRPLPLDEFALTLPYALKYGLDLNIRYEMTETGEIEKMPARGAAFFQAWTGTDSGGSLSGYDPHIIPQPDAPPNNALSRGGSFAISTSAPAKPTHIVARRCPYRKAPTEELYGM